jgi:MFS transporter, putative metabolite transport protein
MGNGDPHRPVLIRIGGSMLIGAAVCAVGAVVSQVLAPETTGLTLTRTAATTTRPDAMDVA